jgi:hypothetical protein
VTAACPTGKIGYPSPQAAHRVLGHLRRRHSDKRKRRGHLSAYQCPSCGFWHTTSGSQR